MTNFRSGSTILRGIISNTDIAWYRHLKGLSRFLRGIISNTDIAWYRHLKGLSTILRGIISNTDIAWYRHLKGLSTILRGIIYNTDIAWYRHLKGLSTILRGIISNTDIAWYRHWKGLNSKKYGGQESNTSRYVLLQCLTAGYSFKILRFFILKRQKTSFSRLRKKLWLFHIYGRPLQRADSGKPITWRKIIANSFPEYPNKLF